MKHITYSCDRCGKKCDRNNVVQLVTQRVNCGQKVEKISKDFCADCYAQIEAAYLKLFEKQGTEVLKRTTVKKVEDEITAPGELKNGPLNDAEIKMLLDLYDSGMDVLDIARTMHRKPSGLKRSITVQLQKRNNVSTSASTSVKEDEAYAGMDIDGILALRRAHWTIEDIAREHHAPILKVQEIITKCKE